VQAQSSVLAGHAGQSEYHNQGERVVTGQHLMQAVSDIFLGWQRAPLPGRAVRPATTTSASCGTGNTPPTSRT
jgi:Uncharacterized protein conserved in bacteria (DUF2252)